MKRLIWLVLPVILAFILSGCFLSAKSVPFDHFYNPVLQAGDIQTEIKNRETLADPDIENHFALAILYTHPRNQTPDYQTAAGHLDAYLANLPPEKKGAQARYINYLLKRINVIDEKISRTQKQLKSESSERQSCQSRYESDQEALRTAGAKLKKSRKKSNRLRGQLKKAQKSSAKVLNEQKRLQIENGELKKQLEKLTDLYLGLEKKRQVIQ
jgi:hypothetical protein